MRTEYAQPGIGAVSIGAWRTLHDRFGVTVQAAAGHSYGEICALCASGMLNTDDFHFLSSHRGKLMSGEDRDRGGMAAVTVPLDDIRNVIEEEKLDLVIANRNAPSQGVISGVGSEIQRALTAFTKRNMRIIPLHVSAAFHSPLVADATRPFGEYLNQVKFGKPAFPVYSNTTAQEYPRQQKQIRDILAAQLENPVEFVDEIKQMWADGVRTFVEIGPGRRMTGLIDQILESEPVVTVTLDASAGKKNGMEDMARVLARLVTLGYPVNLTAWDDGVQTQTRTSNARTGLAVMITGQNYRKEKPPLPAYTITRDGTGAASAYPASGEPGRYLPPAAAFTAIQENLIGLQRLQEQTALLHQQFLTGQQDAQRAFQSLINQQQGVLTGQWNPVSPTHLRTLQPLPTIPVTVSAPTAASTTDRGTAPSTAETDSIADLLRSVVAEKTGYPSDLLELTMELDADLGIDSIKRVEILSALQDRIPGLPPIGPDVMASIRTLNDIVTRLGQHMKITAGVPIPDTRVPVPTGSAIRPLEINPQQHHGAVLAVVAEKTGYPSELLEPGMELDADLGIDSIKRVEILSALQDRIPGLPPIGPETMSTIRTLGDIIDAAGQFQVQQSIRAVSAPSAFTGYIPPTATAPKAATPSAQTTPATPSDAVTINSITKKKGIFDTQPIDSKSSTGPTSEKYIILGIIAEKTGYPVDLLEPEMELETDLGIDSIKRVEILSGLQERFSDLPGVQPDEIAAIRTVRDIIAIVGRVHASLPARTKTGPIITGTGPTESRQRPAEPPPPVSVAPRETMKPGAASEPAVGPADEQKAAPRPAARPEPRPADRDVPKPVLKKGPKPGLDRPQTRPAAPPAPAAVTIPFKMNRKTLRVVPLDDQRPKVEFPEHAEIWITRDDCGLSELIFEEFENQYIPCRLVSLDYLEFVESPDQIAGVIIVGPRDTCNMETLNNMFHLMRMAGKSLRSKEVVDGRKPMLLSVVRLDGAFGLSGRAIDYQPITGALAGMVKTLQHEWPETRCKIIDLDADRRFEPDIHALIREFFLDGPLEMGISARGKVQLELVDAPMELERLTGEPLSPGDWVMVTGGA
ncbi:acyltransferase domain-containing protein, partial [bacterium]|nr:acyltransferase domain-containing protein [candidate division CSSED10-310 bacterium]